MAAAKEQSHTGPCNAFFSYLHFAKSLNTFAKKNKSQVILSRALHLQICFLLRQSEFPLPLQSKFSERLLFNLLKLILKF